MTARSYSRDDAEAWQAVLAFGRAAAEIAAEDPEYVRGHLRRLFWLVNDESGGIGWRAPEMIGAAIAAAPGQFGEFISPLVYLLDLEPEDAPRFRPGVLWAIAEIAATRPKEVASALPLIEPYLEDPDPLVRRLAEECRRRLKPYFSTEIST